MMVSSLLTICSCCWRVSFAGVGLAEPLLDLAHLLDDVGERPAALAVAVLLLDAAARQLFEVLVQVLRLALELPVLRARAARRRRRAALLPTAGPLGAGVSPVSPSFSEQAVEGLVLGEPTSGPAWPRPSWRRPLRLAPDSAGFGGGSGWLPLELLEEAVERVVLGRVLGEAGGGRTEATRPG